MTYDKWPKFKEIGTKKIKLAKVVAKEKKILARDLQLLLELSLNLFSILLICYRHTEDVHEGV